MRHIERVMRRRQVIAFIQADPASIVIERETRVRTPAGGWIPGPPETLRPQQGRIVRAVRRFASPLVNTEAGDITSLPKVLVGRHDMDILPGDEFTWEGDRYTVTSLDSDREERTTAALEYHGEARSANG